MTGGRFRVVLDTNALLRGFVTQSSAAKVLRVAEKRLIVPLLSKPVIDEYHAVLSDPELVTRFPELTPARVDTLMLRLRYISDYIRAPRIGFEYRRDPRDEKFVELAIALDATHILSFDEDLLALPRGHFEAAKRFRRRLPNALVITPSAFVAMYSRQIDEIASQ